MQVSIRGKNIEVTAALREHVAKKLGKVERYFPGEEDLRATVCLAVQRGRHIVEVTISVDGLVLRGEEESADMYASLDLVVDKIERQIRKYKTVINRKLRREAVRPPSPEPAEEERRDALVRRKRVFLQAMSPEEAILQMNLVGHDFFMFFNDEIQEVSVVYRRREGGYGLIEPGD